MSLYNALIGAGYAALPSGHPLRWGRFGTLTKDDLRIAVAHESLATDRGSVLHFDSNDEPVWTICAIIVDTHARKQGKATQGLRDLCAIADAYGLELHLHAAPITLESHTPAMNKPQLINMYQRFGFVLNLDGEIMSRTPHFPERHELRLIKGGARATNHDILTTEQARALWDSLGTKSAPIAFIKADDVTP